MSNVNAPGGSSSSLGRLPDSAPAVGFTVQEGSEVVITSTSLITAATVSGAVAPLFITSIDMSGTGGTALFDPVADAVDYTAGPYSAAAPTGSFDYTVSDGISSWNETASVTITPIASNLMTDIATAGSTSMSVSGYNQRIVLNGSPTFSLTGPQGSNTVFAGSGDDSITLSGYNNFVFGGAGNDTISIGQGSGTVALVGGNNTITATGYNNFITAGNGSDVVLGSQGNSTVTLGSGNQTVVLFGYGNTIAVGDGSSTAGLLGQLSYINAGVGNETVTAGNGTNIVIAGGYGNTITVGNGTNIIFATDPTGGLTAPANLPAGYTATEASLGDSNVALGSGNDWAYLQGYGNTVSAGSGLDAIWGGAGDDKIIVNPHGGNLFVQNFSVTNGDTLDLSKILQGVPLNADLTNVGSFIQVVGHGSDDAAFGIGGDGGTNTQLAVTGLGGTAMINLENTGSMSLGNLLSHHSLTFTS